MKKIVVRLSFIALFTTGFSAYAGAQTANPDITKYTMAIKHNPNDDAAWENRGAVYVKLGKYDLAIADFTRCLAVNPKNFKALASRAGVYAKQDKLDSAILDYSNILENEPDDKNDKNLLTLRGDAYRMRGLYKESVVDYTDGLGIDSTRDTLWHSRGIDYYKLAKYDSASHDFAKALTLHPDVPLYIVHYVLALVNNGSYNLAASVYNDYNLKRLNGFIEEPAFAFLKKYVIACTSNLSNYDYAGALPLLQQAIALYSSPQTTGEKPDKDSVEYANIAAKTGWVYEKLDSINAALNYYDKAQRINPDIQGVGAKITALRYFANRKTVPPVVKLLAPAGSRGITLDSDTSKSRGIVIEADTTKESTIYVKGIAQSPTGISQVRVNGNLVEVKLTDTIGNFETYINDTCTTVRIQAWNKGNVPVDTIFHLAVQKTQNRTVAADFVIPPISDDENFYAVLIACTDYSGRFQPLETTISDAEALKKELLNDYSFKTENILMLYNKNKRQIQTTIDSLLGATSENDNVLIFYGGHGYLDQQSNIAYWVPAMATDRVDFISNGEISELLQNRKARHILVMADACFSGGMRGFDEYTPSKYEYKMNSRQLLTSGSTETVPGVSVFIPNICNMLQLNNARYYSANSLYVDISKSVQIESGKFPRFKDFENISNSGAGQFYFKRKTVDSSLVKPEELAQIKAKEETARLEFEKKKHNYDSLIVDGVIAKDAQNLAQAKALFKVAMDQNPNPLDTRAKNLYDEVDTLINLSPDRRFQIDIDSAEVNEANKDHKRAVKWYNDAISAKPDQKATLTPKLNDLYDKISFFERNDQFMKVADYKGAIKEFNKKLKIDPKDVEYLMGRAACYDALANFDDAYSDLTNAILADRTYTPSTKARAELQVKYGKKRNAIGDYKTYLTINDNDLAVYMKLYQLHNDREIKDQDGAIEDLTNVIRINPRYTEAIFDRGMIYIAQQNYAKALEDFNAALQLDPLPAVYYFERGTCFASLNRIDEAGYDFRTARSHGLDSANVKQIEQDAEDFNFSANEAAGKKNYAEAMVYINRAILINPFSPVYRYEKGNYYFEKDSFETAIKNYDSAIYFNASYNDAFYKRGIAYYNLGEYEKAVDNFNTVIKLNPQDIGATKGRADGYYQLENYTNAATDYEQALKLIDDGKSGSVTDSVKSRMNNNLGYAYFELNSLEQSINTLKKALHYDENYALAYYNLGKSYEKNNALDDAAAKIDKALSYDINNPTWNYSGAEVYRNKSNFAKAIEYYTKALAGDSSGEMITGYYHRGSCYRQTGEFAKALDDYQTAIKNHTDTGFGSFNFEMGVIYENLAKPDSAYIFYQKSFNKDSSDANVQAEFGMAVALYMQKNTDGAFPLFEKALQTKALPKAAIKAERNYNAFRDDKRFKEIYNKYY